MYDWTHIVEFTPSFIFPNSLDTTHSSNLLSRFYLVTNCYSFNHQLTSSLWFHNPSNSLGYTLVLPSISIIFLTTSSLLNLFHFIQPTLLHHHFPFNAHFYLSRAYASSMGPFSFIYPLCHPHAQVLTYHGWSVRGNIILLC